METAGHGTARPFHQSDSGLGGEGTLVAALPRYRRLCGIEALPAPADLPALWRDAEVDEVRQLRCVQRDARVDQRASGAFSFNSWWRRACPRRGSFDAN